MIKVYTEVLGFNNLMYRYMSLPNSLSLADLAYYTLASYLSEEYADFVIESNGIHFKKISACIRHIFIHDRICNHLVRHRICKEVVVSGGKIFGIKLFKM